MKEDSCNFCWFPHKWSKILFYATSCELQTGSWRKQILLILSWLTVHCYTAKHRQAGRTDLKLMLTSTLLFYRSLFEEVCVCVRQGKKWINRFLVIRKLKKIIQVKLCCFTKQQIKHKSEAFSAFLRLVVCFGIWNIPLHNNIILPVDFLNEMIILKSNFNFLLSRSSNITVPYHVYSASDGQYVIFISGPLCFAFIPSCFRWKQDMQTNHGFISATMWWRGFLL